jgi:high affinity Mn2+ porin
MADDELFPLNCNSARAIAGGTPRHTLSRRLAVTMASTVLMFASGAMVSGAMVSSAVAADMAVKAPPQPVSTAYDWSGFYLGGNVGYAWGKSNFSDPPDGISGSMGLSQTINTFDESGSFLVGAQGGYNYMLPNRWVIGGEFDLSAPSFQNPTGISVSGMSTFASPFGSETYTENMLVSGTMRARIGYAPGHWLLYATGGLAWSYNQLSLTNNVTGVSDSPFLWRLGWAAGAGVETPIAPHWTARLEYLYTDYGNRSVMFANNAQNFSSNWSLSELRAGVDYHFGADQTAAEKTAGIDPDEVNFHGQTTFTWQGYPAMRSAFSGPNSLPSSGEGRETTDATLYAGIRLWQGAEFWVNPEIDQGFGIGNAHGVAGYTSGEAYKLGFSDPYARVQRYFVRQTINLGGDSQKIDADINQFEESVTANRLVLWVGKFAAVDIFDTNKFANNPKSDFLNWSVINAGTFDYAGDAWGYSYGAAAEWYQGDWTVRGGVFDMSQVPAETSAPITALAYGLDPTFDQFQMIGELERRYELGGQPGVIKITGYVTRGRMASFQDAIDVWLTSPAGTDINNVTAAVRKYQSKPGVSLNLTQQITDDVGLFARAGWADGHVEPWDFTDIDQTGQLGLSIAGKKWGRPDDTIGIVGVVNHIDGVHQAWLNDGGLGVLVGDGALPNPGLEEIFETYYSYALTSSVKLTADYQFINNPGYNTDRGPANVFAGRVHWQF